MASKRIALIGDIHANLHALEAVLHHAKKQLAEEIWCIGDLVGYGPYPDEVVSLIRSHKILNLQGNYDRKVTQVPKKAKKWAQTKSPEKWYAFQWAFENLSSDNLEYLQNLPKRRRLTMAGWDILLVHGSPISQDEHLTPATPIERFEELAAKAHADIVVCGHSHIPFHRSTAGTTFVNTGSVGRPDDGDPRAAYALLQLGQGYLEIDHVRIDYDLASTLSAMQDRGLPLSFQEMLRQGYSLEQIENRSHLQNR